MNQMFSNATVAFSEGEIVERECLIRQIFQAVSAAWTGINPRVRFSRVETPILTPPGCLGDHLAVGFPMLETKCGVLRPETTVGCTSAFHAMFPQAAQRAKRLPFCVWQAGKSFRDEANPQTMRATRLRLREFWQQEFELFAAEGTRVDYLQIALQKLVSKWGGKIVTPSNLPHYSRRTLDWEIEGLEIAGCSERTDWKEGMLFEVSVGLDRLLAVRSQFCAQ